MTINWEEIPEQAMRNFKGGDGITWVKMYSDGQNRLLMARILPGSSIGEHTHETNSEMIYVLEGEGCMILDGQEEILRADMCHYCPKGKSHSLINDSDADLHFFAIVPEQ